MSSRRLRNSLCDSALDNAARMTARHSGSLR